jgi:hypothetical protein
MVATLITGLVLFAFLFAVNSATHSYLIVRYVNRDSRCFVSLYKSVVFYLPPVCANSSAAHSYLIVRYVTWLTIEVIGVKVWV